MTCNYFLYLPSVTASLGSIFKVGYDLGAKEIAEVIPPHSIRLGKWSAKLCAKVQEQSQVNMRNCLVNVQLNLA